LSVKYPYADYVVSAYRVCNEMCECCHLFTLEITIERRDKRLLIWGLECICVVIERCAKRVGSKNGYFQDLSRTFCRCLCQSEI
jgi:hypothetical protein